MGYHGRIVLLLDLLDLALQGLLLLLLLRLHRELDLRRRDLLGRGDSTLVNRLICVDLERGTSHTHYDIFPAHLLEPKVLLVLRFGGHL